MQSVLFFLKDFFLRQKFIIDLAKNDFKKKYLGSYLGIIWAFIQPTINILIFWFVFQVGFKNMPVDNFPFILWLASAMIPWNFFADSIISSSNAIMDNSFLVKKMVFRVGILPVIKIYSAFFVHAFFILFLIVMFLFYGYMPTIYLLQIPYYLIALFVLLLGIGWLTSALTVFFRDVGQIVAMITQFGFWLTPIFYDLKIIPDKYIFWLKLNPMFYITEGYRESFIYHKWFWEHPKVSLSFWCISAFFLIIGAYVFKKMKPHFADVL